jgi:hypothetical protein
LFQNDILRGSHFLLAQLPRRRDGRGPRRHSVREPVVQLDGATGFPVMERLCRGPQSVIAGKPGPTKRGVRTPTSPANP